MRNVIADLPKPKDASTALFLVRRALEADDRQRRAKAALFRELMISILLFAGWWLVAGLFETVSTVARTMAAAGGTITFLGAIVAFLVFFLTRMVDGDAPHRLPLFGRSWASLLAGVAAIVAVGPAWALVRAAFQISSSWMNASLTKYFEGPSISSRAILRDPRTTELLWDLSNEVAEWEKSQRTANRLITLANNAGLALDEHEERMIAECEATRALLIPRMHIAGDLYEEGEFGTFADDASAVDAIRRAERLLPDLTGRCEAVSIQADRLLAGREAVRAS